MAGEDDRWLPQNFQGHGIVHVIVPDGANWTGELLTRNLPLRGTVDVARPRRVPGSYPRFERVQVDVDQLLRIG